MLTLGSEYFVYAFAPDMKAVAEISAGGKAVFETQDCFAGQIRSEKTLCTDIDFGNINPATGPLAIAGAVAGDLLGVAIERIDLAEQAVAVVVPGEGAMPERIAEPLTRILAIDGARKTCTFRGMTLPLKPMIGVIGVATSADTIPTGTPGRHGGNMDTRDITEGAVIWFPVARDGAMLAMGDCHALMGDGEVGCSGAEVDARVTVSVDLLKSASFPWPILVTPSEIMVIASAENLDLAAKIAAEAMTELASRSLGLDFSDALMLSSMCMDLRVSQVVDPQKTARAVLPLDILPWEKAKKALLDARGTWALRYTHAV